MKHKLQTVAIVALSLVSLSSSAFIAVNWSKLAKEDSPPVAKRAKKRVPSSVAPESQRRDQVIMRDIRSRSAELQACYNDFLQRTPGQTPGQTPAETEGAIRLSWVVDPQGQVGAVNLMESELEDGAFDECVLSRIKAWSFRAAPDTPSFLVTHKFSFRPHTIAGSDD